MTPDANDLCVFAVKRGYIESKEIYCNPLYPTYLSLVEKYQHSPYANGILNNHVAVNPKTDCSLLSDSSEVSFVPMANVQVWGDRIFEKCGIGRDEGGDGGKTLEIRGKRRLSARDGGANYQQS